MTSFNVGTLVETIRSRLPRPGRLSDSLGVRQDSAQSRAGLFTPGGLKAAVTAAWRGPTGKETATSVVALLVLLVVTTVAFPSPAAILFLGAVLGSLSALIAMGIVLVYRANRIINFAAGELGAIAGLLGVLLIAGPRWPYFIALAAGLAAAIAVGILVEFLFVRRFLTAERLILTVATIGIAQILAFGQLALPRAFGRSLAPQDFPVPFDFSWEWSPVIFRAPHLMALVVSLLAAVALALFFRLSRTGVAVRATAESMERAAQLGIPVTRIGSLVWGIAAALGATAALLRAPIVGIPIGRVLGPGLLLRALAAAVIARMESLPMAFGAAIVLGMVEQTVFWDTGRSEIVDVVLFVVIVLALLVQRRRSSRAEDDGTSSWASVREVRPVPVELRRVPEVRYLFPNAQIVLFGLLAAVPLLLPPSRVNLLGSGVILAILGVSLVILTGWAGQVSLGHMALFGFGAATATKAVSLGWNFLIALVLAGIVGATIAALLGLPALRIKGSFLAVITFAFSLATSAFFLNSEFFGWFVVETRIARPALFGKFSLESEHTFFYLLLVALICVLVSVRSVRASRTGRVLVAARDNERAAQSFGVSVVRARLTGFALSGFYAAVAGGLFAMHQHSLGRSAYTPEESIRIFTMVVFGGLGSIPGVVLGAVYFMALDYFVVLPMTRFLVSGVGLLLVLLVFPGGLGEILYGLRDSFLRFVARRRRILVPSLFADTRDVELGFSTAGEKGLEFLRSANFSGGDPYEVPPSEQDSSTETTAVDASSGESPNGAPTTPARARGQRGATKRRSADAGPTGRRTSRTAKQSKTGSKAGTRTSSAETPTNGSNAKGRTNGKRNTS